MMLLSCAAALFFRPGVYRHSYECGQYPVESLWQCSGGSRFPQVLKSGERGQCGAVLHTVWRGEGEDYVTLDVVLCKKVRHTAPCGVLVSNIGPGRRMYMESTDLLMNTM